MWIEEAPVPLAAVVEQMADALIFADTNGQIRLWNPSAVALVRGPAGAVIGATAVGRDVTARFEEEKALRQRLRELDQ
jgi:nitrogen fixation/metabolism regulation signal transduction histidine kinase